jgi:hypothetical protein
VIFDGNIPIGDISGSDLVFQVKTLDTIEVKFVVVLKRLFDTIFDLVFIDVNFKDRCPQPAEAKVLELGSSSRFTH